MSNIDDRLKEHRTIEAAVQRFQKRVMADPDLACHFGGMDVRRIMAHQINLLSLLFGESAQQGPASS